MAEGILIAGSVKLDALLDQLQANRPVFHSEADFQQALAWEAKHLDPLLKVRLETCPEPGVYLDLLFSRPTLGRQTFVELKYLCAAWTGEFDAEHYALKDQSAQDIRAYDVVKDIARLEGFVSGRPDSNGILICLSNDPAYWLPVKHNRPTNADAFRLREGTVLSGIRRWGPLTGAGTRKNREAALALRGEYPLRWRDYSQLEGGRGRFRALVVEVAGA